MQRGEEIRTREHYGQSEHNGSSWQETLQTSQCFSPMSILSSWAKETMEHLFSSCHFSSACWNYIGFQWDFNLNFHDMILHQWLLFGHLCFMEVFLLAAWNIWKHLNNLVFNNVLPTTSSWKRAFKADLSLHLVGLRDDKKLFVQSWIDIL